MKNQVSCKTTQSFQTIKNAFGQFAFATLCGILLLLATSPASAQISKTPRFLRQHTPARFHGAPSQQGKVETENWSGYAVTGSGFNFAKGSWHVPEVDCSKTPNTYSAFWVGIDGYTDGTVEQTGTASDCNGTTPQYYAWYEFYPSGSHIITSVPVKAGDIIGASVTYAGGVFTVSIHDRTTGKIYTTEQQVAGAERSSAEWIAEAPCCTSGGNILPLADFDVANFGQDYTNDAGTNFATDSSTSGPIAHFGSNVQEITMVSSSNVIEAEPTSLTGDGTSFRVYWKSE
jgi:hypothetical protein